jgi:hypothetical protein
MHAASSQSGEDPLLGRTIADRYQIERPLGEGGIGKVYRAVDTRLGRQVALKVLLTKYEQEPVLRQRFDREAAALSRLSHPNIVTVTDYGVSEEGVPFLAMELLEGVDLHGLIKGAIIPPQRGLAIMRQVLRALAYAHGQNLVHRDLKPHNVFVRDLGDGTDHVTVLDFGLARFTDYGGAKLTKVGALLGTPAYMAPEQARGTSDVDATADVYAVGVVLFEVLTGRRPFDSPNPGDVLRGHLQEPPPRLSVADTGLEASPALQQLLDRAMAKAPGDRFPSAVAMVEALEALPPDAARRVGPRVDMAGPTLGAPPVARTRGGDATAPPMMATTDAANLFDRPSPRRPRSLLWLALALGVIVFILVAGVVGFALTWQLRSEASSSAEEVAPAPSAPALAPAPPSSPAPSPAPAPATAPPEAPPEAPPGRGPLAALGPEPALYVEVRDLLWSPPRLEREEALAEHVDALRYALQDPSPEGRYLLAQSLLRRPDEGSLEESRSLFERVLREGEADGPDFRDDPAMLPALLRLVERGRRPVYGCLLSYYYREGIPQRAEALEVVEARRPRRLLEGGRQVRACARILEPAAPRGQPSTARGAVRPSLPPPSPPTAVAPATHSRSTAAARPSNPPAAPRPLPGNSLDRPLDN